MGSLLAAAEGSRPAVGTLPADSPPAEDILSMETARSLKLFLMPSHCAIFVASTGLSGHTNLKICFMLHGSCLADPASLIQRGLYSPRVSKPINCGQYGRSRLSDGLQKRKVRRKIRRGVSGGARISSNYVANYAQFRRHRLSIRQE